MKTETKSAGINRDGCATSLQTEESPFFQEWLAAGQPPEQLSISSVCNAQCLFCSNRMNPFPIRQNVFRNIEDVKLQLSMGSANYEGDIHMSDSLPGRISEGEAFLHPDFFEILALVREKFLINRLHFTTNASLLNEPFVRRLASFRPLEINVSMHSTQPKLWARIFQRPGTLAQVALDSLGLLKKYRIHFTGTIVPLPRICGWEDIEKTFAYLVSSGAGSILLWWPGFSEKTPPGLRKKIECPREEFQDFVKRMQDKYPRYPVIPQPNPAECLKLPVRRIMKFTLSGNLKTSGGAFREVLWLVSEAAYPEISRMVAEFGRDVPNEHHVFAVKNRSYGGNIQVSGLLMVSDFLAAGREGLRQWPAADLVLVPRMAFDAFFRDLKKTPAFRIPEILGRTTWLVFEKGSFLSLKGRGFVKPGNDLQKTLERMLKSIDESLREDRLDALLSMVSAFPVPTSQGLLKKREFQKFLQGMKNHLSADAVFEKRTFEKLDDDRVACMEEWPAPDPSATRSRWFLFRKMGNHWKLEIVFLGQGS